MRSCGVSTLSQGIPPATCLDFCVWTESFWEQDHPWVLFAQPCWWLLTQRAVALDPTLSQHPQGLLMAGGWGLGSDPRLREALGDGNLPDGAVRIRIPGWKCPPRAGSNPQHSPECWIPPGMGTPPKIPHRVQRNSPNCSDSC